MANLTQILAQRSVTGMFVTPDALENPIPLVVDGAAPALFIAVPLGTISVVSDWAVCGPINVRGRLQQSNDLGVTWFDRCIVILPGGLTRLFKFKNPLKVVGSPTTLLRVLIQTPGGGGQLVTTTLRLFNES